MAGEMLERVTCVGPISLIWGQMPRLREQMTDWPCPVSCALNKPMAEHSDEEFVECFVQFATAQKGPNPA